MTTAPSQGDLATVIVLCSGCCCGEGRSGLRLTLAPASHGCPPEAPRDADLWRALWQDVPDAARALLNPAASRYSRIHSWAEVYDVETRSFATINWRDERESLLRRAAAFANAVVAA